MYRVVTNTKIVQKPTKDFPERNRTMIFDFVHELSCSDSWRDLTNDGKIIIPKNLYIRDKNNKLKPLFGTNNNIGGFSSTAPLLMRGDEVTIDWGYRYFKNGKEIFEGTYDNQNDTHLFKGYISKVTSKKPIEFCVEDNMWKLKQLPAPTKTFKATDTLENIIKFLLIPYNIGKSLNQQFTVNALTSTTFGEFRTGNETVAEVLARLRKQYHFESYFRGNELRCGVAIYIPSEARKFTFTFQKDIISDQLDYRRRDDLVLSILASNTVEEETGRTTRDGYAKTKCNRLEVLVTLRNGSDKPDILMKKKDEDFPSNTGGERMTLTYPGAKSIDDLIKLSTDELRKYYYTGFKGKFTTFGMPYIHLGDYTQLIDPILPERNGLYQVKSVEYIGGINGLRQEIELDYLILN
jgi:hypothetical protein